jgi:glycosyltransferase involved in cell wall biosynthesis
MHLSVVVPVYDEEDSLPLLVDAVRDALEPTGMDYELICVDDGSRDRSGLVLEQLAANHPRLVVCSFRRNFGQTAALQAGISAARGDVIAMLDADLQNDPVDIPKMMVKLDEGYDLVAGWRARREDAFINRRLPSIIANKIISVATRVNLHDYGCTLKVMRADLAKELRLYGEMHRFIPVMASLIGARIVEMPVTHHRRRFGQSKYGIGRTVGVMLDLFTVLFLRSYLVRPMKVFGLAGLIAFGGGIVVAAYLTYLKLGLGHELANRPLLLMAVLLILVGIQLLSLGLVADVVGRTYHEAQRRPPYHVRKWINRAAPTPALPEG